jgi:hypothetical protein
MTWNVSVVIIAIADSSIPSSPSITNPRRSILARGFPPRARYVLTILFDQRKDELSNHNSPKNCVLGEPIDPAPLDCATHNSLKA